MASWSIRAARESDIDRLMELLLTLQEHHESRNSQLWRLTANGRERLKEQLVQFLADEDSRVFVAVNDSGAIAGMAIGQIRRNDSYMPAVSASVRRLFVVEEWRNLGIGTELVKCLCQFFASLHVEDISIQYIAGNDEAARFWEKLGFQPRILTAGISLYDLKRGIDRTQGEEKQWPDGNTRSWNTR